MHRRAHIRWKHGLHVSRRVVRAGGDWQWTDNGDALATGGFPGGSGDSVEPHFSEGLDDGPSWRFDGFRSGARRIVVDMPETSILRQCPQRLGSRQIATDVSRSLARRHIAIAGDWWRLRKPREACRACDHAKQKEPLTPRGMHVGCHLGVMLFLEPPAPIRQSASAGRPRPQSAPVPASQLLAFVKSGNSAHRRRCAAGDSCDSAGNGPGTTRKSVVDARS